MTSSRRVSALRIRPESRGRSPRTGIIAQPEPRRHSDESWQHQIRPDMPVEGDHEALELICLDAIRSAWRVCGPKAESVVEPSDSCAQRGKVRL